MDQQCVQCNNIFFTDQLDNGALRCAVCADAYRKKVNQQKTLRFTCFSCGYSDVLSSISDGRYVDCPKCEVIQINPFFVKEKNFVDVVGGVVGDIVDITDARSDETRYNTAATLLNLDLKIVMSAETKWKEWIDAAVLASGGNLLAAIDFLARHPDRYK